MTQSVMVQRQVTPQGQGSATHGRYLEVQVATARPEQLVLMCYDGLLGFLRRAEEALVRGRRPEAHEAMVRAQAIVAELRASLRTDAGEVAAQLDRVYEFLQNHLVEANIRKDRRRVGEARLVAEALRDAWAELCRQLNGVACAR